MIGGKIHNGVIQPDTLNPDNDRTVCPNDGTGLVYDGLVSVKMPPYGYRKNHRYYCPICGHEEIGHWVELSYRPDESLYNMDEDDGSVLMNLFQKIRAAGLIVVTLP